MENVKNTLTDAQKLQAYTELTNRANLAKKMGMSYQGNRDLFATLGYPTDLSYADYYAQYDRQELAAAVVDKPIKGSWRGDISLDTESDSLRNAWDTLFDELGLKQSFIELDKMNSLGEYAVMLYGFSDVTDIHGYANEVSKSTELLYTKVYNQTQAIIHTLETNTNNPRYGKPLTYQISMSKGVDGTVDVVVHNSRILHITGDTLGDAYKGIPVLKKVFNRLKDVEKLSGGSAEMFWRGARPGYQGKIHEDYQSTPELDDELTKQLDEYENNLRRIINLEGMTLEQLQTQVSSPKDHIDIQLNLIAAQTEIPKRILTGSEKAELASSQDKDAWIGVLQTRREEFLEIQILNPFIKHLQKVGVLEDTIFTIAWSDLYAPSKKDIVDIGKVRALSLKEYTINPAAESMVSPHEFFTKFLGFTEEEADEIEQAQTGELLKESDDV